jgi:YVTN family beta-propeller protein
MRAVNRRQAFTTGIITVVTAVASGVLAMPGPAQAAADELDLAGYGDLVVDQTRRHLFVTGGEASNVVLVTDLSGRRVKTITGQYGATGLALNAAGTHLYVALATGDAISVIDTKSLTETARYPTGAQTCPTHLARTENLIWFGYGCDGTWSGGIGRLDTAAEAPVAERNKQGDDVSFQRAPLLSSATDADGPVSAAQLQLSLSTVYVYPVVDGALSTTPTSGDAPGSNVNDAALSPDGATLFTAAGSRNSIPAYSATDLAGRGSYATGYYPDSVAPSPDGKYLAGGVRNPQDDVYVYKIDGVTPVRRINLGDELLLDRGLTWSPKSDRLYAVTQGADGGAPTLHVITNPT